MRYIEGQYLDESVSCIVLFGNGSQDRRVTRAIARKFNGGRKTLLALQLPYHRPGSFSASIDTIAASITLFEVEVENYILVIDRELIGKDVKQQIREYFEILDTVENDDLIQVKVRKGSYKGSLYIAIQGRSKSIEENIAHLIKLTYGIDIKPDKSEIRKFFRERGIRIRDLIEESTKEALKEAFKSLVKAIELVDN